MREITKGKMQAPGAVPGASTQQSAVNSATCSATTEQCSVETAKVLPSQSSEKDCRGREYPRLGDRIEGQVRGRSEWFPFTVEFMYGDEGFRGRAENGIAVDFWYTDSDWRWPTCSGCGRGMAETCHCDCETPSGKVAVPAAHAVSEKSAQPAASKGDLPRDGERVGESVWCGRHRCWDDECVRTAVPAAPSGCEKAALPVERDVRKEAVLPVCGNCGCKLVATDPYGGLCAPCQRAREVQRTKCARKGCDKPATVGQWCGGHYTCASSVTADAMPAVTGEDIRRGLKTGVCAVPGCGKRSYGYGALCKVHDPSVRELMREDEPAEPEPLARSVVPEVDPPGSIQREEEQLSGFNQYKNCSCPDPIPEEEEQPNDKQPPSPPMVRCSVCGEDCDGAFVCGDEPRCPGHMYLRPGYRPPPSAEQLLVVKQVVEQRLGVPVKVTYDPPAVTSFGVRTCLVEGCGAVLGDDAGPMCAVHAQTPHKLEEQAARYAVVDWAALENAVAFGAETFEEAWQALADCSMVDPAAVAICKRLRDLEVRR